MPNLNYNSFVIRHKMLHRCIYFSVLAIGVFVCFVKNVSVDNKGLLPAYFLVVGFYYLATELFSLLNYFDSPNLHTVFKFSEIVTYGVFLAQMLEHPVICVVGCLLVFLVAIQYITYGAEYDVTTLLVRKILFALSLAVNVGVVIGTKSERFWVISFLADFLLFCLVQFIVEWLSGQVRYFDKQKNELYCMLDDLDEANLKLTEYRDRMIAVNEQINLQKIDLSRANKEMEETNRDIAAQSEVLKYIVSAFDIPKCVEVMANSIVDIRKAKLCAIYLLGGEYSGNQPLTIIKSDYSSVERRLKKDIQQIYSDFMPKHKQAVVYTGEDALADFRFIGDSNIKTMAIIPILDKKIKYGIMMIASHDERYFTHGTGKFDSDVVGLRLALKNADMYLEMQKMARHDGLTGIYNRLYFTELFANTCKTASKKKTPFSIALFDIDHFKHVNDTYGHLAGDEVLIAVAHVSDAIAKKYKGYCCRFGGEEFLVVLPGYETDEALKVFEELHENIKKIRVEFQNHIITVDVCIGMTTYPTICTSTNTMINCADKAMYYGKNHGRGRLIIDSKDLEGESDEGISN